MLRAEHVSLSYGAEPVLEGASLAIEAGQFVSLVGPSGSGKSSLLRAVMGLQGISAGRIELQGVQGNDIGILFQDDALLPWRTAIENVALGLRLRGRDRRAAVAEGKEWLARLGLAGFEARYPRELSGGQRKRVALAQVLALKPRLLLMDEPFASLDAIVRARVTQDVVDLVEQQGISVLLVTHDLEEAIALSDRVYLLSQGPRAHISQCYTIPIPRPRHLMRARTHPKFGPLLERLWSDLSQAVEGAGPVAEAA
ncbi:MAG TPA: ABC transporter ATP-binding protein [Beijerinckiaceae bacterium]